MTVRLKDEPAVVDDGELAAGKQPLQQLLEVRPGGGDLGSRGPGAAGLGMHLTQPLQQGGHSLVDQSRLQDGDVGARSLGVEGAAVRAQARPACRAADVQA